MAESNLKVELREKGSKADLKKMRREGKVPAIFYTHGEDAKPISMNLREFYRLVNQKVNVFDLDFGKGGMKTGIIREIQMDPIRGDVIHVDLLGISTTEKVNIKVPIHLVGIPIGVKAEDGVLEHPTREIEIACLPKDIPTSIDVDVTELGIHDSLRVEDLNLGTIEILAEKSTLLALVVPPKVEVEEVEEVDEELGEEGEEVEGEGAQEAEGEGSEEG